MSILSKYTSVLKGKSELIFLHLSRININQLWFNQDYQLEDYQIMTIIKLK